MLIELLRAGMLYVWCIAAVKLRWKAAVMLSWIMAVEEGWIVTVKLSWIGAVKLWWFYHQKHLKAFSRSSRSSKTI